MKQEIVNAFDGVTMPEGCEKRIRRAMTENQPKRPFTALKRLGTAVAAFAVMLAMTLCLSTEARAAAYRVVKYFFPESDITVYEEVDENGNTVGITVVDTEAPPFAEIRDEKLFFVGNGENLDITGRITEDSPYYYTYIDDYGLTHYMAVGYSGTIENYGIYEFIREVRDGQQDWEGWVTGSGRNFLNPETDTRYAWVETVWQDLNIPWSLPGE